MSDTLHKILDAADEIANLYTLPNGGAGGMAHIVVDDDNLDDESIAWCLEYIGSNKSDELYKDVGCQSGLVLQKLIGLSESDRWYAVRCGHNSDARKALGECLKDIPRPSDRAR